MVQIMMPVVEFDGYGGMKDTIYQFASDDRIDFYMYPDEVDGLIMWWTAEDGWIVRPEGSMSFWQWLLEPAPWGAWLVLFAALVLIFYFLIRHLEDQWYKDDEV